MDYTYKKGVYPWLDEEFAAAQPFGKLRLGKNGIFSRRGLRWSYIPVSLIARAYRRIEEVNGKTGCCSNDFSIHKLMLVKTDGELLPLLIGDSLYRHEPEKLMEAMQSQWPALAYGKE